MRWDGFKLQALSGFEGLEGLEGLQACRLAGWPPGLQAGHQACLPPIKLLHSCDPTEATVPEAPS